MGQNQAQGTGQRITFPVGEGPVGCTLRLHDLLSNSLIGSICLFCKLGCDFFVAESQICDEIAARCRCTQHP